MLASTLGLDDFGRCRVTVFGDAAEASEVRLVVQVLGRNGARHLPVGAAQRVVNASSLARGVEVSVLHDAGVVEGCQVLVWIEPNGSELEFGALTATPEAATTIASGTLRGDELVVHLPSAQSAYAAA